MPIDTTYHFQDWSIGADRPTDRRVALEHQCLPAGAGQVERRDEPIVSCPDDQRVICLRRAFLLSALLGTGIAVSFCGLSSDFPAPSPGAISGCSRSSEAAYAMGDF